MGGRVPLGYKVVDRKLVVDEAAAGMVQHLFRRYLELGSVTALSAETNEAVDPHNVPYGRPQQGERYHTARWVAVNSTICCRTRSISASCAIMIRSMMGSMRGLSSQRCSMPCRCHFARRRRNADPDRTIGTFIC